MIRLINIFLFIFLLTSCLKKDGDGFNVFKIKKGHHRSITRIEYTKTSTLTFTFILTESCKYESIDPINQYDVNKLYGMSDGGVHTDNSARVGWRYLNNKLEIMAYTHYNGNFQFEKICEVEPNNVNSCQISFLDDMYQFNVNNNIVYLPRYKNTSKRKYLLYPYFGGDEVAPHDIEIKIKRE